MAARKQRGWLKKYPAAETTRSSSFNQPLVEKAQAALEAGQPPDFLFGSPATARFPDGLTKTGWRTSRDASARSWTCSTLTHRSATLLNGKTGRRGLYALPMGRYSNHVHVWASLLERAGFTLADIPKEWDAFWSFWCDRVQPAVRRATGRDDIWGVGLSMSAARTDTDDELFQFQLAYEAPWSPARAVFRSTIPRCGRAWSRPEDYTAIWRKGCTPPDR